MSDMTSVSSSYPCEKCGRTKFCGWKRTEDGHILRHCREDTGDWKSISAQGGYIYLEDDDGTSVERRRENLPLARVERRDAAYTDMLKLCDVSDREWEHFTLKRRINHLDLELLNYKTVKDVAQDLVEYGHILERVPGFYRLRGEWKMITPDGYFIPVLDRDGLIQALQVRTYGDAAYKYMWFTSNSPRLREAGAELGSSAGAPVHLRFANRESKLAWITESPVKADLGWLRTNVNVLANAGVGAAHDELIDLVTDLGFISIVIAFDGNWRTNIDVARQVIKLAGGLVPMLNPLGGLIERTGITPMIAVWGNEGGWDDAINDSLAVDAICYDDWLKLVPEEFINKIRGDWEKANDKQRVSSRSRAPRLGVPVSDNNKRVGIRPSAPSARGRAVRDR